MGASDETGGEVKVAEDVGEAGQKRGDARGSGCGGGRRRVEQARVKHGGGLGRHLQLGTDLVQ